MNAETACKTEGEEEKKDREYFVVNALKLMETGVSLESAAKTLKVPHKQLAKWVCKFRLYGFHGFRRKPYKRRARIITPRAAAEALRREGVVLKALKLMQEGESQKRAAYKLKVPMLQLCRWRRAYEQGGLKALLPKSSKFGPQPKPWQYVDYES